jgi:hypothetical protein
MVVKSWRKVEETQEWTDREQLGVFFAKVDPRECKQRKEEEKKQKKCAMKWATNASRFFRIPSSLSLLSTSDSVCSWKTLCEVIVDSVGKG